MRPRRAFVLAELVVAMLILSTLSVVLVGVIPATIIGAKSAARRATAAMLARESMEDLVRDGFDNLPSSPVVHPAQELQNVKYSAEVSVEPALDSAGTALDDTIVKMVVVKVRWEDRGEKVYTARTNFYRMP